MSHEFHKGDPVLVRARYVEPAVSDAKRVMVGVSGGFYYYVPAADLIPDDRRPEWLPGQPGDVAEFTADAENEYGDPVHATRWMRGRLGWWAPGMGGNWISDDDVPADAVLVLPAPTRT